MADNIDPNDALVEISDDAVAEALAARRDTLPPFAPHAEEQEAEIRELPGVINPADWSGSIIPKRRFLMEGWIVRGACGLLSGQEGVGKSLLAQQMATCAAVGAPFLGQPIAEVPAVYITCEDPADELLRRQADINKALGIRMGELDGRLSLVSLKGQIGNELGTFTNDGRLQIAARYRQLEKFCTEFGAGMVHLDNAAHFFTGNENARHDVAIFLGLLERLSATIDGAVILLAHPNKAHAQGNKEGNEFSGSTGWSAHVRNRLFLDWAETDAQGNFLGEDGRLLRKSKANYAKQGEELAFRWHEWAFVRDEDLPDNTRADLAEISLANSENAAFLACLRERASQGESRFVGPAPGRNYAPSQFEGMPAAKGFDRAALKRAMDRLYRIGKIETVTIRNKSKSRDVDVIQEVPDRTPIAPPIASRPHPDPRPDRSPIAPRSHPDHTPDRLPLLTEGGEAVGDGPPSEMGAGQ